MLQINYSSGGTPSTTIPEYWTRKYSMDNIGAVFLTTFVIDPTKVGRKIAFQS